MARNLALSIFHKLWGLPFLINGINVSAVKNQAKWVFF